MAKDKITIRGARQHNLNSIDVDIPRDRLVVITGLSGSGKSSLAFDTIYAEGQRRFIESLSSYARQFLGVMDKPDVDSIEGLSPAISIQQHSASKNPRSTVSTATEIHDHLRLLYARIGVPHCPECAREIEKQSIDQIIDRIMGSGRREVIVLAPVVAGKKGTHVSILQSLRTKGYHVVRVDGVEYRVDKVPDLDKNKKHDITVVLDKVYADNAHRDQLADDVSQAIALSEGILVIEAGGEDPIYFSERMSCPVHGISIPDLEPRMFSFNSPFGACRECSGIGFTLDVSEDLVIPDTDKSIAEGAITLFRSDFDGSYTLGMLETLGRKVGFSLDVPWKDLSDIARNAVLYGSRHTISWYIGPPGDTQYRSSKPFEGIIPTIKRRYKQTQSEGMREFYRRFMRSTPCPSCGGARLKPASLSVTVGGINIHEVTRMSIKDSLEFFNSLPASLNEVDRMISRLVLREITERLTFLKDVGLDYLSLDRNTGTLSGGEAQRIQLATQIGSSLVGVLYILDEPSIGLHQRDNRRLIGTLERLRDLGNTIIIVEHDEEVIRRSDHIIDLGPGAGIHGGDIVGEGSVEDICGSERSITGKYLSGEARIPTPQKRVRGNGKELLIKGARQHNLKDIDVKFPLGTITCVTGVSGSGKSTLVDEILYKELKRRIYGSRVISGDHDDLLGAGDIDKVIVIDQSPIGRTPRSNPATYTGAFTPIRELFSKVVLAKERGYKVGRFSFNVKGGRCDHCEGDGIIKLEMHFLPDVYIPCEVCKERRYNRETLEVRFKGKNISDVLNMDVETALSFFQNIPAIRNKLQTLNDVGLGYIKLGQPATTLSGGEAQRVKLSTELSKRSTGKTIYLLDEPTTGLHFDDVKKLLKVLIRLRDKGNTVVIIEHNLDVIKTADWIIDLGPEGGDEGGEVVVSGTPEKVARSKKGHTGWYLKKVL